MKRIYTKNFIGSLFMLLCLSSCYDDTSTLATSDIGNITFSDDNSNIYVGYQQEIELKPTLGISDVVNQDALKYEWSITTTTSTTFSSNEYEVIGTDRDLKWTVERPIESAPYILKLTISDPGHSDMQYINAYNVYVQSSFLDGILVADTKDGNTSDFTLINNSDFTMNYSSDEHIYRNILATANGKGYQGVFSLLKYAPYALNSSAQINQVYAVTDDGNCVRFNSKDFSINGELTDGKIILSQASGTTVSNVINSYQELYVLTSNGLYSNTPITQNIFSIPRNTFSGYSVSNNIFATSPNQSYITNYLGSNNNNHMSFYDEKKGAFFTISGSFGMFASIDSYQESSAFDPNNIPGLSTVAAVVSEDALQTTFLMKDNSGQYAIYTFSSYTSEDGYYEDEENWEGWVTTIPEQPASAKDKFIIPEQGKTLLDNAVSVFFSNKNQVIYVATPDGIYTINYGTGSTATVNSTAKYTPASGEKISKVKMYKEGIYTWDLGLFHDSAYTPTAWNNSSLMIATQSEEYNGKIYIIPVTQLTIGTMDTSKAKTYSGFGKILDFITTGY